MGVRIDQHYPPRAVRPLSSERTDRKRLRNVILDALHEHLAHGSKKGHLLVMRIEEHTVARADQRRRMRRGGVIGWRSTSGGFFSGLILGLGAATLVNSVQSETPRYPGNGVQDDWFAIGNDLRSAMRQANGEEG